MSSDEVMELNEVVESAEMSIYICSDRTTAASPRTDHRS